MPDTVFVAASQLTSPRDWYDYIRDWIPALLGVGALFWSWRVVRYQGKLNYDHDIAKRMLISLRRFSSTFFENRRVLAYIMETGITKQQDAYLIQLTAAESAGEMIRRHHENFLKEANSLVLLLDEADAVYNIQLSRMFIEISSQATVQITHAYRIFLEAIRSGIYQEQEQISFPCRILDDCPAIILDLSIKEDSGDLGEALSRELDGLAEAFRPLLLRSRLSPKVSS